MLPLTSSSDNTGEAVPTPCPAIHPCPAPPMSRPQTLGSVSPKSHHDAGLNCSVEEALHHCCWGRPCWRKAAAAAKREPVLLSEGDVPGSARCCWQDHLCLYHWALIRWVLTLRLSAAGSRLRYSQQFNDEWHHLGTFCFVENDEIRGKMPTLPYFNFFFFF